MLYLGRAGIVCFGCRLPHDWETWAGVNLHRRHTWVTDVLIYTPFLCGDLKLGVHFFFFFCILDLSDSVQSYLSLYNYMKCMKRNF